MVCTVVALRWTFQGDCRRSCHKLPLHRYYSAVQVGDDVLYGVVAVASVSPHNVLEAISMHVLG